MAKIKFLTDKLSNLVANLGTGRDKAVATTYDTPYITDLELMNAYRGAWMPKKIVDIPAFDACRKWRDWQADSSDVSKIEALEKTLQVQAKIHEALRKGRLFGGAALYIATNESDVSKPLRESEKIRHLTVLTKRRLTPGHLELDPDSPYFLQPSYYVIANTHVYIHPSRLVLFKGVALPDEELALANEYGWGDSVLTAAFDAVRNSDSTAANIASLVFEAKVDVIKIPDFMAGLEDPEYERRVLERLRLAAAAKGINGALLLDKEEEYDQKTANFSSLRDILEQSLQIVAGAADMPVVRFLGTSPTGLNSTGESDLSNYYDSVNSKQELEMRPAMVKLDELLVRNALGTNPSDVWYKWSSLWQISDKDAAEIGSKVSETIRTLAETNLFPADALSRAAVTTLSERGILPGLEQAVNDLAFEASGDIIEEEGGALVSDRATLMDGEPRPLYVQRRVVNAQAIRQWAEAQGIPTQDELHVTIMYSRKPVNWMKMGRDWSEDSDGRIRIPPGGPREISLLEGGALALEFDHSPLKYRHQDMRMNGASWDWEEYRPHITLALGISEEFDLRAIDPYPGAIVLGPEVFEELKDE